MKRTKHLMATLLGLAALGWAGYAYASLCPDVTYESVTLQLVSVTSDGSPGDATPYQGAVVRLTVIDAGSDVSLQIARAQNQGAITEKYNATR